MSRSSSSQEKQYSWNGGLSDSGSRSPTPFDKNDEDANLYIANLKSAYSTVKSINAKGQSSSADECYSVDVAKPMKALWNALKDTSVPVEGIMAIVNDPSCGLERRSSKKDGRIEGREVAGTNHPWLWIDGGYTPLMLAALACRVDVMKAFLNGGADMRGLESGSHSQTPLHKAAKCGRLEGIELLIAYGVEVDIRRCEGNWVGGITPLMDATELGNDAKVRALIDNGADVNTTDTMGRSPLHYAAGGLAPTQMSKLLLAEGANLNAKDKSNSTPLHEAAAVGSLATIELFLKCGTDINAVGTGGATVLHLLERYVPRSLAQLIDQLVAKGADVNAVDVFGYTPLHLAANNGCEEDIMALVSNGALVNVKDNKGCIPLHVLKNDKRRVAEALIDCGADVNAVDEDQATPLHNACKFGKFEIAKLFVLNGANVQARDSGGNTTLHFTVRWFRETNLDEFINFLVSKGADVNASNQSGITPLHSAVDLPGCIKLLCQRC